MRKINVSKIFLVKICTQFTKFASSEMTYWRNDLLFLYFWFIVFSIVTLPTGSYMSHVLKQYSFFGYF